MKKKIWNLGLGCLRLGHGPGLGCWGLALGLELGCWGLGLGLIGGLTWLTLSVTFFLHSNMFVCLFFLGYVCEEHNNPADFFLDSILENQTAIMSSRLAHPDFADEGLYDPWRWSGVGLRGFEFVSKSVLKKQASVSSGSRGRVGKRVKVL